ncbi:nitrilase-related carbon-nitrogen hydrolase [Conexibacter arvalis]|uniref:Putative amidohydrolase n=1 Tax=Conexibacter arvalis TaxID=912552 RepID=A0A840IJG1_9ACTN|nr:putative amidohydrolase [Conexibacter arvalis]
MRPTVAACDFAVRRPTSFDDFAADVRAALDRAGEADLIVLPELLSFGLAALGDPADPLALADRADDLRARFEQEARRRATHLLAGSQLCRRDDGAVENVAHVYGPDGLIATHAKTHLFSEEARMGIAEGDDLCVLRLPFADVGVAICYEAEIPEVVTALVDAGADVIACPSFTITEAGFWRVRHCLAARCVENQVFAVHCGVSGAPFDGFPGGWARASVLGPCDAPWPDDGVIAQAEPNAGGVARATLEIDALAVNRREGAVRTHADRRRRAPLYDAWRAASPAPATTTAEA